MSPPGPSVGMALHLAFKTPLLAQSGTLGICLNSHHVRIISVEDGAPVNFMGEGGLCNHLCPLMKFFHNKQLSPFEPVKLKWVG